jgi:hypothetical protein
MAVSVGGVLAATVFTAALLMTVTLVLPRVRGRPAGLTWAERVRADERLMRMAPLPVTLPLTPRPQGAPSTPGRPPHAAIVAVRNDTAGARRVTMAAPSVGGETLGGDPSTRGGQQTSASSLPADEIRPSPLFGGPAGPAGARSPLPVSSAAWLRDLAGRVPALAQVRRATAAERDSVARDEARRWAAARDAHRPAPLPVGGGVAVGLPGGGPTRAQRQRDSVVHQQNVERLGRLRERAARRGDSVTPPGPQP